MNLKELRELIEFLIDKDIAEFELERGDVKVRVKRAGESHSTADARYIALHPAPTAPVVLANGGAVVASAPVTSPSSAPAPKESAPAEELHIIRSPIVGTFYESPSPGSPPFVKAGDAVETGQVLCIVEAMKLMNEIESDVAGEIVRKLASNGQPIEYGQQLFEVRPRK
jgi:acetyl-CoA carboxylase biotin carboxyl carrier protein